MNGLLERKFAYRDQDIQTDGGDEYCTLNLFFRDTGFARQSSDKTIKEESKRRTDITAPIIMMRSMLSMRSHINF